MGALDGQQLLVVEGSGWRRRQESDSQVFCHPKLGASVQQYRQRHRCYIMSEPQPPQPTTTHRFKQVACLFFCRISVCPSGRPWKVHAWAAVRARPADGVRDACEHGGAMSKPASVRQWSQPCITVVMWGRAVRSPHGGHKTTEGEVEEHEKYGALRRQRAPQLEARRAPLSEVAGPPGTACRHSPLPL